MAVICPVAEPDVLSFSPINLHGIHPELAIANKILRVYSSPLSMLTASKIASKIYQLLFSAQNCRVLQACLHVGLQKLRIALNTIG